jgi:hypothetical protein
MYTIVDTKKVAGFRRELHTLPEKDSGPAQGPDGFFVLAFLIIAARRSPT